MKLVIAGIGGQGVVFATKVLSHAAMSKGQRVMASENHGMSQRGGSVTSHVKIDEGDAPLIRRGTADALISFDRMEATRNLTFVRRGGSVVVNTPNGLEATIAARLRELEISVLEVDAAACARELGAPNAINLIVLGLAAAQCRLGMTVDELKEAVRALGPARAVELNVRALEAGARASPPTPLLTAIRLPSGEGAGG